MELAVVRRDLDDPVATVVSCNFLTYVDLMYFRVFHRVLELFLGRIGGITGSLWDIIFESPQPARVLFLAAVLSWLFVQLAAMI